MQCEWKQNGCSCIVFNSLLFEDCAKFIYVFVLKIAVKNRKLGVKLGSQCYALDRVSYFIRS